MEFIIFINNHARLRRRLSSMRYQIVALYFQARCIINEIKGQDQLIRWVLGKPEGYVAGRRRVFRAGENTPAVEAA